MEWNYFLEKTSKLLRDYHRDNRGPGVDGEALNTYLSDGSSHLERLERELREGVYKPRPIQYQLFPKGAAELPRLVYSLSNRDYLVAKSISVYLKSLPGFGVKSTKGVVREIENAVLSKKLRLSAIGRVDIKNFFNSLDYSRTVRALQSAGGIDEDVLDVVEKISDCIAKLEEDELQVHSGIYRRDRKIAPQGIPYSPMIADWFIGEIVEKHWLWPKNIYYFRYSDDAFLAFPDGFSRAKIRCSIIRIRLVFWHFGLSVHPFQGQSDKSRIVWAGSAEPGLKFLGIGFEIGEDGFLERSIPADVLKKEKTILWKLFNRYFGKNAHSRFKRSTTWQLSNYLKYRLLLRSAGCKYRGKTYGFVNYWAVASDPSTFKVLDNYVDKKVKEFHGVHSEVKSYYFKTYHKVKGSKYRESFAIDFDNLDKGGREKVLVNYFGISKAFLNTMSSDQLDVYWHNTLRGELQGIFGADLVPGSG